MEERENARVSDREQKKRRDTMTEGFPVSNSYTGDDGGR